MSRKRGRQPVAYLGISSHAHQLVELVGGGQKVEQALTTQLDEMSRKRRVENNALTRTFVSMTSRNPHPAFASPAWRVAVAAWSIRDSSASGARSANFSRASAKV